MVKNLSFDFEENFSWIENHDLTSQYYIHFIFKQSCNKMG